MAKNERKKEENKSFTSVPIAWCGDKKTTIAGAL